MKFCGPGLSMKPAPAASPAKAASSTLIDRIVGPSLVLKERRRTKKMDYSEKWDGKIGYCSGGWTPIEEGRCARAFVERMALVSADRRGHGRHWEPGSIRPVQCCIF